ncbi:phosphoglycerate dehydrogenase [Pullulanibacillus sp. KACC 23026]|uniref:phosphoglycerate dehydrogenase n=1 Tax=Pullulanibacillus sp. KACC 23026 TaxID=3028315 RepID=UPI0023AF3A2E|nr:phosphoglycerate dehydrogenase [Pullulanibacillus sp. KACC 23026]WEG10831.1 phosphoglycerate dehydrogenase [Pullulanibacillus sp. KACC 23026]
MKHKILVSDPMSESGLELILKNDAFEVDLLTDLKEEELLEIVHQYDGWIVRSGTQVTARLIQSASHLKIVGRSGVGVDNIDVEAATKAGVIVVNAPDGNTISACEHTLAMLMALSRKIPAAVQTMNEGKWNRSAFKGVELSGKILGIVGFGRIGVEVSKRAKAFNMTIMAYDPFLTEERAEKLGVQLSTLEDIYEAADFITVHTPLIKETHHLINEKAFSLMKPGVRIINCARGGIIDETALYKAILSKKVAGAALDVFESEPPTDHPLIGLDEVITTPHLGASTVEAQEKVAVTICEEFIRFFQDEPVHHAVNLPNFSSQTRKALEPFMELSVKLGQVAAQLIEGGPKTIDITYSGELAELSTDLLTRYLLMGVLKRYLGSQINLINVKHFVKENGLEYNVKRSPHAEGFTGLITLSLKAGTQSRSISGTLLNGYGSRIVKLDRYSVDLPTEGHLLIIQHHDLPGLIGQVGTLLGKQSINIGSMQVGRTSVGGEAIMVLTVDRHVDALHQAALERLEHIKQVTFVDL